MPKVSIIVPVYNVEKYLIHLLESILSQTFADWECILVDDGSKDKSGAICDEYAARDNRFIVVHKQNGGVSSARNQGVGMCSAEWCCFIDSDDWLEPDYLINFFVDCYERYDCILQSFYFNYDRREVLHSLPDKIIKKSSELEYFLEYTNGVHNGFLWHRLFRLEIIKNFNIRFPEGISFAEDGVFFLNYILHSENFAVTANAGYHHLIRMNSLTSKGKRMPKENFYFLLRNYAKLTKQIIEKDNSSEKIANGLKKFIWRLLYKWIIKRCMNNKSDYLDNYLFLSQFFDKYQVHHDVHGVSLIYKSIIKDLSMPPTFYRYNKLRLFIYCRDVEVKAKVILKNLF